MTVHTFSIIALFLLSLSHLMPAVVGHARLLHPPSRASMWRFGFNAPIDYNDNEGFCGGAAVLHETYNGKCGVCGDVWDPIPRAHERGGPFYSGYVTATFKAGEIVTAVVQLTANHGGFFEFRVCPYDNPEAGDLELDTAGKMVEVSQACLDKHLLRMENGQGTKFYLNSTNIGYYNASVKLPVDLHCKKCLFQWRYKTGNSWGTDENGYSCVGCGKQEEFKACADIIIEPSDEVSTVMPMTSTQNGETSEDTTTELTETTTDNPVTMSSSTTSQTTTTAGTGGCRPTAIYAEVPGMTEWCIINCNAGYCPASHCVCNI